MLTTLIHNDKKKKKIISIFDPVQKKMIGYLKFYSLSDVTVYVCINSPYINLLSLSWIKKKKNLFLRNMEP